MARMGPNVNDQAYQFYQQEALDLLQVLESGLLTLRNEFNIPKLHNLMRAAHSIKGGAASVQLPGIQKIAHRLEDVLRALYRREEPIDTDLEEALLMAYDRLRAPLQEQVFTGEYDEAAAWEDAEPVFAILESVLADDLGADIELPTASELGIDVISEVFSGDVNQSLQRLAKVLEESEPEIIVGEIRAIAEVFIGIGDLLSLPGFAAIARCSLKAIDIQPEEALLIGQVSLENFQAAYEVIMAGDREEGGSPSQALLDLADGGHWSGENQDTEASPGDFWVADSSQTELAIDQGEPEALVESEIQSETEFEAESETIHPNWWIAEDSDAEDGFFDQVGDHVDGEDFVDNPELIDPGLVDDRAAGNVLAGNAIDEENGHEDTIIQFIPTEATMTEGVADQDDAEDSYLGDDPIEYPDLHHLATVFDLEADPFGLTHASSPGMDDRPGWEPDAQAAPHHIPNQEIPRSELTIDQSQYFLTADALESLSDLPDLTNDDLSQPFLGPQAEPGEETLLETGSVTPFPEQSGQAPGVNDTSLAELFSQDSEQPEANGITDVAADTVDVADVVDIIDVEAVLGQAAEAMEYPDPRLVGEAGDLTPPEPVSEPVISSATVSTERSTSSGYEDLEDVFGQADVSPPHTPASPPQESSNGRSAQPSPPKSSLPSKSKTTEGANKKAEASLGSVQPPKKPTSPESSQKSQPSKAKTTPSAASNRAKSPEPAKPDSPKGAPQTTELPTAPKAESTSTPYITDSVRVDSSRLERLNNLVGELVTQENGSSLQSQQLQTTLTNLQQRFIRFEGVSKQLQDWMDQSQKLQVRTYGPQEADVSKVAETSPNSFDPQSEISYTLGDFDSLQMDSYNDLYTLMQGSLEEIAHMGELMRDMVLITQQSQQTQRKKQQTLRQVRNDLLWARMMPLGGLLQRFPRMIRDLSTKHEKQVRFIQSGMNTLVDKGVLERLYDPLVHLVRNAFDHGTESPAERLAAGKSAEATIEIRAYHRGNQTLIEVRDDGRGIDLEAVRRTAIARDLLSEEEASAATKEQLYQCLFAPNFSTKAEVSDLSGRGMGMSAVQNQVRSLKGTIAISSTPGQGTTFVIRLPLTLTIAKLLVFSVNGYLMSIPVDTLVAIISAAQNEIQTIQGHPVYRYQEQFVPIYPTSAFNHHYPLPKGMSGKLRPMTLPQNNQVPLLVVADGDDMIALEVDHILTEQELVIKSFSSVFAPPPYLYGCTILGDGSIVPVVDGSVLIARWQESPDTPLSEGFGSVVPDLTTNSNIPTILVVDDSLTARQTLTQTLQKSGYQAIQAGNGREALVQLQQGTNVQAVFCDVEMPHMNGFEFLTNCRKDYPASTLPIIMLTSRSSEKHRGIAKLLGANEYLTKPYLEQELLRTLQSCLQGKSSKAKDSSAKAPNARDAKANEMESNEAKSNEVSYAVH